MQNGRFEKYEGKLREILKSVNYKGEYLGSTELKEWREFGITDYGDLKTLKKEIEKLVEGSKGRSMARELEGEGEGQVGETAGALFY